jgi:hypothetical protein
MPYHPDRDQEIDALYLAIGISRNDYRGGGPCAQDLEDDKSRVMDLVEPVAPGETYLAFDWDPDKGTFSYTPAVKKDTE